MRTNRTKPAACLTFLLALTSLPLIMNSDSRCSIRGMAARSPSRWLPPSAMAPIESMAARLPHKADGDLPGIGHRSSLGAFLAKMRHDAVLTSIMALAAVPGKPVASVMRLMVFGREHPRDAHCGVI